MAKPELLPTSEQPLIPRINAHLTRWCLCKNLFAVCFYTLLAHCWPRNSVEALAYKSHAALSQEQANWRKQQLAEEEPGSTALSRTRFAR